MLGDPESDPHAHSKICNALSTKLIKYFLDTTHRSWTIQTYKIWSRVGWKWPNRNFGWTVEIQVKAAKMGLNCGEVPVRYRRLWYRTIKKFPVLSKEVSLQVKNTPSPFFREKWIRGAKHCSPFLQFIYSIIILHPNFEVLNFMSINLFIYFYLNYIANELLVLAS